MRLKDVGRRAPGAQGQRAQRDAQRDGAHLDVVGVQVKRHRNIYVLPNVRRPPLDGRFTTNPILSFGCSSVYQSTKQPQRRQERRDYCPHSNPLPDKGEGA